MKNMNFIDKYNSAVGGIVTVLTAIFGIYWYVFAAYLIFNIIDWLSGWYKAYKNNVESSKVGLRGILKKVGYWAIILVAFIIADVFVNLGNDLLHVDLSFLALIGWFTLAMLLVNEARSILENLVECGYKIPDVLIKGLAITEKLIEAAEGKTDDPNDSGITGQKTE